MAYLLLMLYKGAHFRFLFAITAAGVVPCGGRKMSPRTSAIVRIIFSFLSFEIGKGILKNKKLIYFLNRFKMFGIHFDLNRLYFPIGLLRSARAEISENNDGFRFIF